NKLWRMAHNLIISGTENHSVPEVEPANRRNHRSRGRSHSQHKAGHGANTIRRELSWFERDDRSNSNTPSVLSFQALLEKGTSISQVASLPMKYSYSEHSLRANVQINDAPGCTLNDLCVIVEHLIVHAAVGTGLKSVHDAALLAIMWETPTHTLCFWRTVLHIFRVKTSVVQGVSIYKSAEYWQQCILHAFCMLFISYDESSEYLFPLVPRTFNTLADNYSDEASSVGSLTLSFNSLFFSVSLVSSKIRNRLQPEIRSTVRPHMSCHSLRRGASREDQSVAKVLEGYPSSTYRYVLRPLMSCSLLEATGRNNTTPAYVCHYLYELGRRITTNNNLLGSSISIRTSCKRGFHLNARWRTMNNA
ncbi:hypothetical protein PHMEG_00014107, partial [Phytophthora megakarya]